MKPRIAQPAISRLIKLGALAAAAAALAGCVVVPAGPPRAYGYVAPPPPPVVVRPYRPWGYYPHRHYYRGYYD